MRSHSLKAVFALAALCAFLLVPASAMAGKPVNDFFGTQGSGNGQFGFPPGGLAVNQSSNDLYAFDQVNNRVQVFDEEGTYLSQFGEEGSGNGQFQAGALFPPAQLALDQGDGSVYVADPGNNRIQKFEADGTFLAAIDSVAGSPSFETLLEPKGVAVGTDGSLYVADTGHSRIVKFDSSGAYVSEFGVEGFGQGELIAPAGVAVDSTDAVYVFDSDFGFGGRVQKFSPTGVYESSIEPGETLSAVATDLTNDHLFVSGHFDIYEYDATGALLDTHHVDPSGVNLSFYGLAVNDEGGPIYGVNLNGGSSEQEGTWILILDEPGISAPSATIDPVTTFDADSASFNGEVNPNGNVAAQWRFQVSADGGESWSDAGSGGTVPEGTTPEPVSAEVTGLEPNTEYQARLVATKWFLTGQAIDSTSFTTEAVPPEIEPLYPGPVTDSTAWLGAHVNPKNAATTFYVEYSTDPGFASSVSAPLGEDASAGSGSEPSLATQLVEGLQPETTYHYRVVAVNVAGTVTGVSRSFTTVKSSVRTRGLPDGRVWEKVSPSFKAGADINAGNFFNGGLFDERSQAAIDGDGVTYGSAGKFAGGGEGAPGQSQYVARRGADGWTTEAVSPPMDPAVGPLENKSYYRWFSDDLALGAVTTHAALRPGDPKDIYNLYLRDNATGEYLPISTNDDSTPAGTLSDLRGATGNGQHLIYRTSNADQFFAESALRERTFDGAERPVSVLPDDSVVPADLGTGKDGFVPGFNPISTDGSRIFFSTSNDSAVYVRQDHASTTLISASERSGDDPSVPQAADFLGASTNGSIAFFRSATALTEESSPSGSPGCQYEYVTDARPVDACALFRWDGTAPAGSRLTDLTADDPSAQVLGMVGMADDGATAYFVAYGELASGASATGPNLYMWKQGGGVRFIATVLDGYKDSDLGLWARWLLTIQKEPGESFNDEPYKPARVNSDGRYLTFSSHRPQTAYNTNGKQAIYLYDSQTGRISCISCGTVEPKSKGDSWFVSCQSEDVAETRCLTNSYLPHNFRADGKRLIFDSADALVPEDTNGVTDVYQWQEGRLHLLSSGTSAFASRFVDASADGDDVFFTTAQQLTPSDQDSLRDLYDARVGGRPEPSVKPPCVADECQGTPNPPPDFGSPASMSFDGPGNQREGVNPLSRCNRAAIKAKRLSRQAKRLGRNAKRLNPRGKPRAVQLNRRARRLSRRAKGLSKNAKRCRTRVRAGRRVAR